MRILIVEDSASDRELLLELLQNNFMTEAKFREARNLASASEYLKRGDFDCVLLDLNLPDSTGWDTFDHIHRAYPEIPIVVITHNRSQRLALQLIRRGAGDVIAKDFTNPKTVFQRIQFAVERDRLAKGYALEEADTLDDSTNPGSMPPRSD
jgi:CheY-like chemotaxis protein